MKELNLHEEIIKSLKLMIYDRSLTLSEQGIGGYAGIPGGPVTTYTVTPTSQEKREAEIRREFEKKSKKVYAGKCKTMLNDPNLDENERTAKEVFLALEDQIGHHWYDVTTWGTNDKIILNSIKKIKHQKTYDDLLSFIDMCYPEYAGHTVIELLQQTEYSEGQKDVEKRVWSLEGMSGPMRNIPEMIQWYGNDMTLKAIEGELKIFNPNETYHQEDSKGENYEKDWGKFWGAVMKEWKTQVPPLSREIFHYASLLAALALTIFSGGATSALVAAFIIDVVDATAYMMEGDPWMAGFCFVFALVPPLQALKGEVKALKEYYKELKALTPTARKKAIESNSRFAKLLKIANDKRILYRAYFEYFKMTIKDLIKKYIFKNIIDFVKLILWLVKKGYIVAKFLTKTALMLGTVYITWGGLAILLGIEEIEKDPEFKDKYIDINTETLFGVAAENKVVITRSNRNTYSELILLLQYTLIHAGYNNLSKTQLPSYSFINGVLTINNSKNITEFKIFTSFGQLVESVVNSKKLNVLKSKKITGEGVFIIQTKNTNGETNKMKIINGSKGNINTSLYNPSGIQYPKFGYYDSVTEEMVRNYQRKNNLNVDGKFGPQVMDSIILKIKTNQIIRIKNILNKPIDNKKVLKKLMSQLNNTVDKQVGSLLGALNSYDPNNFQINRMPDLGVIERGIEEIK